MSARRQFRLVAVASAALAADLLSNLLTRLWLTKPVPIGPPRPRATHTTGMASDLGGNQPTALLRAATGPTVEGQGVAS